MATATVTSFNAVSMAGTWLNRRLLIALPRLALRLAK